MVLVFLISLPFLMLDVTIQSRGMIRSQSEPTSIQTSITGQVKEIRIRENMKVSVGDTLIRLAPEKIDDQQKMLDAKISLYSGYIHDLEILSSGRETQLQSDLLKSSYSEYNQKLKEYQLQIETTSKDFKRTKSLFEKEVIAAAEFEKKELELNQLIKEKECYVSPNDIGYLQVGKSATFQVDAYNYNQWGLANGTIIDISNQPYQENKTVYFKVKCKLNQDCLSLKSGYQGKLKNGLTLTSRFLVNRRSLYDLLFDKTDDWLNPKIISN
jgi:hypothetical protein